MAETVNAAALRVPRPAERGRPGRVGAWHRSRRALVVDDEPLVGRTLARLAECCGLETALATNAAAFRARYDLAPPDIVLLDLSLPGGDGIELLRFLAERRSEALVLIVSGFDSRVVESAVRLGSALGLTMGGALAKPVRANELAARLAELSSRIPSTGADHELCA